MKIKNFLSLFGAFTAIVWLSASFMPTGTETVNFRSYMVRWQTSGAARKAYPDSKDVFSRTATDTIASVRGTRRDTSCVFEMRPYMSAKITMADTSSSDSCHATFILYSASDQPNRRRVPAWTDFVFVDSVVVTSSATKNFLITDAAIAIDKYGVLIVRGNGNNKKVSPSTSRVVISDWQQ